jgi:hypothetical protein
MQISHLRPSAQDEDKVYGDIIRIIDLGRSQAGRSEEAKS